MGWLEVALRLIKQFEGCKLQAYPDPATGGAPWTIGYGATGPWIAKGTVWTQAQAEADLIERVTALEHFIDEKVKWELTDEEMGAIISLVYNIGNGNFNSSTLLKDLNACKIEEAALEFPKWNKAAGHIMKGLVTRRGGEMAQFLIGANFGIRVLG